MTNQSPGAEPKMVEICKFCGCEWYRKYLIFDGARTPDEPPPPYVIDASEFPIKAVFKICHCPCHWDDKTMEVYLEAIREIFPDLVPVGV